MEFDIVCVERKLGVEFIAADCRAWSLRFAGADVEEAELVPD